MTDSFSHNKEKSIKKLFTKSKSSTIHQLFRYFFVGGAAALVDIGSFTLIMRYFIIDYKIAIFLSFTLGTLANFTLCNIFVFERKSLSIVHTGIRHYLSSLGGLFTNEIVMIFLIDIINFKTLLVAKIIATGCAFIVNFSLIKFYAFNDKLKLFLKANKD